jgi:DNA-directed RNA polymerase specialized sigma24 family protein
VHKSRFLHRCNGIYRVANTRFFGGLSLEEAAEALGVSERVVHRHWDRARAWLSREVRDSA